MDHFQELTTRGEFIGFVFGFLILGELSLGISRFLFFDGAGRGDVAVRRLLVVGVYSSVLSVQGALQEPASNSTTAKEESYEWTVFNVFIAEVGG
jgi:hypothetical protein